LSLQYFWLACVTEVCSFLFWRSDIVLAVIDTVQEVAFMLQNVKGFSSELIIILFGSQFYYVYAALFILA